MNKSVTFTIGWVNYVLSIAIIAIRAFQPNAQPMCDWSFWSWCLMLLPITWPFILVALVYVLKGIVYLFDRKSRTI